MTLLETITAHLNASPKNRVAIVAYGGSKITAYAPKHLPLFVGGTDTGVWVMQGKRKVFVFANAIRLGRME